VNGVNVGLVFQRTIANGNDEEGFLLIQVSQSLFETSSASNNGLEGVLFGSDSDGNLLRSFVAQGNGREGVFVQLGDRNTLDGVRALDNDSSGIRVAGDDNKVLSSVASKNDQDGVLVESGATGTLLKDDTANQNDDDGFDIEDSDTTLRSNLAKDNGGFNINAPNGFTSLGGNKTCVKRNCGTS
jgi:hypothetical protein